MSPICPLRTFAQIWAHARRGLPVFSDPPPDQPTSPTTAVLDLAPGPVRLLVTHVVKGLASRVGRAPARLVVAGLGYPHRYHDPGSRRREPRQDQLTTGRGRNRRTGRR